MATVKITKTVIECFKACGKKYKIMQDENGNFWGIDYNDLQNNGVSGLAGNLNRTLTATLRRCYIRARVEELLQDKDTENPKVRILAAVTASNEATQMFND